MFLDRLLRLNPALAVAVVRAHQEGDLPANTYALDLDAFEANTRAVRDAADRHGLRLYAMTKQFGRNPDAAAAIVRGGIKSAVCVDVQCMEAIQRGPLRVGHVGHLVQPHRGTEDGVIQAEPEVVTVFTEEVAQRIGRAAVRARREQPLLLRVIAPRDRFYFGHGGGFPIEGIVDAARRVDGIAGVRVAGVTTFPAILANLETRQIEPTPNFETLRIAADSLRAAGFNVEQVNAPGTTSAGTMQLLADCGATHVEPGNSLHGTTPLHLFDADQPEVPAIVYVSEVGHLEGDDAYVFGAGFYIDKVLGEYQLRALVGRDESIVERVVPAEMATDGAIHYYGKLHLRTGHDVRIGDTVVFCYRPQVFVTRGRTVGISGIGKPSPTLGRLFDSEARLVEGIA